MVAWSGRIVVHCRTLSAIDNLPTCTFCLDPDSTPYQITDEQLAAIHPPAVAIYTVTPSANYNEGLDTPSTTLIHHDWLVCPGHTFLWLYNLRPNQVLSICKTTVEQDQDID